MLERSEARLKLLVQARVPCNDGGRAGPCAVARGGARCGALDIGVAREAQIVVAAEEDELMARSGLGGLRACGELRQQHGMPTSAYVVYNLLRNALRHDFDVAAHLRPACSGTPVWRAARVCMLRSHDLVLVR